jgi:RNA polymerase sigma-70 factor (family 1)
MGNLSGQGDSVLNHLLLLLKEDDEVAFEALYNHISKRLFQFVYGKVRSKEVTEEILQEIFVSLWNNRKTLEVNISIEAYLYGAAKNKIMSFIRSELVRKKYAAEFTRFAKERYDNSVEEQINANDLQMILQLKMAELPGQCRAAFRMSRMEHKPILQIAEKMNISTRTVENYITQALRHLRTNLGELLFLVTGIFF